jgi:conjugative relaxase-like TrwC/TraI family protein
MRSIHTIKSGNREKKDYYTKDESLKQSKDKDQKAYYGKGEGEVQGKTQAIWFGKDAARLNLKGHAEQADFEQIYDGFIPGTQDRIRGEKPREDHQENCLYDVVLSCKKSVSMQIHLGQDERLYKAYQETVLEIAKLVENDYAQARIQTNGDRRIVQTGGIIALMIPHHTSREMDMNVHTHLAITNGTYCEDGKWRSLLDRGFSHAYYMGDYFSARLAARVQALGYEIRETVTEEGHPSWELAGYTDEQIKVFSKRSENAKVKELVAAGMSRDDALMRTRKAKNAEETLEEAQGRWKVEADAFEIEAITPLDRPVEPKLRTTPEQVLESAIRHYSNRSNHFTRDKIREYAFKLNRTFTVEDLDRAIAIHPSLIDYGKIRNVDELRGHFTTVGAVEREIRTIKAWMQGKGLATAILGREAATQALEQTQLKTGQREAIIGVLASNNQHQIIHGLSGVGKTTALRQLKALTDLCSVEVMGFAPSIDAAKKLSTELGIETHTVQSLVKKNFDLKPNQILIIDEAGMVSAEMMDVVMQKANAAGARVLLVGDTGQNQAIEAGSPMRSLMQHGAEVHHIAEIIRQQNSIQRQAVELIAKGRGLDALSLLNEHDYINPIPDREYRVSALAAEFLSLSPEEQLNTLIVAGTNAEKDAITAQIRAGLKAEGRLGQSVRVVELQYAIPTPEEAQDISCYSVGDTVTLAMLHKGFSVQKPKLCFTVLAQKDDALVLRSTEGKIYQFNPALSILNTSIKVTQLRDRALTPEEAKQIAYYRMGDYIKFSRNYKRISERDYERTWLQKNVPYQVVGKDGNELIVSTAGGRRFRVNPSLMKDKQVFEGHEFDVAVGDSLRWTSSNQEKGQINGKTFKIAALDGNVATILTDDGLRQLDLSEALAVDYTLTSTSYRAQGSDRPRVFVSATNDPTSNREPFYVSISRQIKELKVWTDDYEGLKRRVAESNVQSNPLELIGDDYGKRSDISALATNVDVEPEHGGIERTEQGTEIPNEQRHEHSANRSQGRDGDISDPVRGTAGEPEAFRDGGRDSGIERNPEGIQGQTDELGTDARRHVFSSELRDRGDQNLHSETAQQRLDESAADLRSLIERIVSSLNVLDDVDLVRDSGIVESTREAIAALEPIVSGLEAPSVTVPPKRDLSAAMERAINALTAADSEKVFSESGIVEEIKSLVSRVEAHTLSQEQLTKLGEHYGNVNSNSESNELTARRDSGVESDARESRIDPDGRDSGIERLTANIDIPSGQSSFISRGDGNEADDRELARGVREAHQRATETDRNQERDFPNRKTEPGDRPGTTRDRQVEHGDASSKLKDARTTKRGAESSDRIIGSSRDLQWIADAIYRARIQRELAEPLALLQSTLAELREVNRLNNEIKAEIEDRHVDIAAKRANVTTKLEQYLAQAKVEVLDTTLKEWRSLRDEPGLELPEAIAPSEVVKLTSLIENYPAQKVIEYAMVEFNQAREQALETNTSSLDSATKPKKNPPPKTKPKQSTAPPGQTASPPNPKTRTQRSPMPKPVKPVEIAPFWQPDYATTQRPEQIEPTHWEEFQRSAIHPELIGLNIESVSGQEVYERLLSERLAQLGTGQYVTQPMARLMAQYESLTDGGWWGTAGIDAMSLVNLQPGYKPTQSDWGTFKGDNPRIDQDKAQRKGEPQLIKYEHPAGTGRHLYLVNVHDALAQKIYTKHGVQPIALEKQSGFWAVVKAHPEIPINLGEGLKKTLSSISQGDVQIGSSGVNGFYRARDTQGNRLPERVLNEELAVFAVPGRVFRFTFDQDTKASTVQAVRRDMVRTIELLEARGCVCLVAKWNPDQGKGLDDLIANQGPQAYARAIANAHPAEREKQIHYRTEFNAIARQIRKAQPDITNEALDVEVYLRAVAKGESKDGDRFVSQSDHARNLKDPALHQKYVEHIRAIAPHYHQRLREQAEHRTAYDDFVKQAEQELGAMSGERLDMEVYLRASVSGVNAEALISQGGIAESLKDPALIQAYIERVKIAAPQYQQQQELEAAVRAQPAMDRIAYVAIAQQLRSELGDIPDQQLDIEIYLRCADSELDIKSILAQSDQAQTLSTPSQVQDYIERIKADAPQYRQYQELEAQQAQDRSEYEALAQGFRNTPAEISTQAIDMEVYLIAEREDSPGDGDRLIAQSDHARSLPNEQEVLAYVGRIKTEAPQYQQQRIETAKAQATERAQRNADRVLYLSTANEVRQALGKISAERLDVEVHLRVGAAGGNPDRVLTQSDRAQTLGNPSDVNAHVERLKGLGLAQVRRQADEQHKLNLRVLTAGRTLVSWGGQTTKAGWRVWGKGDCWFGEKGDEFRVNCFTRRKRILELKDGKLEGTVTPKDVERFERAVVAGLNAARSSRRKIQKSSDLEI